MLSMLLAPTLGLDFDQEPRSSFTFFLWSPPYSSLLGNGVTGRGEDDIFSTSSSRQVSKSNRLHRWLAD